MAAPCCFKKSSSLFFTADAIVDLIQKLIDVAAVADAIQNEIAEIFTICPGRAACVLLPVLETVGDEVSHRASIAQAIRQELPEQSPPFQAVRYKVAEVLPAPYAIFQKVAEIVAALQAVANEITETGRASPCGPPNRHGHRRDQPEDREGLRVPADDPR
jgi:hypothetical protein